MKKTGLIARVTRMWLSARLRTTKASTSITNSITVCEVCVCVCGRERECVNVCVCVTEREREREREGGGGREGGGQEDSQ